jgi:hypothetical protein
MTDLEITKRCAEAMELSAIQYSRVGKVAYNAIQYITDIPDEAELITYELEGLRNVYNPLVSDIQCMALVKKFRINVIWYEVNMPSMFEPNVSMWLKNDLNRAICECVAKLQKEKK